MIGHVLSVAVTMIRFFFPFVIIRDCATAIVLHTRM
jgi:hypothetical protein